MKRIAKHYFYTSPAVDRPWCTAIVREEEALSRSEREVLKKLLEVREADIESLSRLTGYPPTSLASIIELLKSRGLVEVSEVKKLIVKTSSEGASYADQGLPEERLVNELLRRGGRASAKDLAEALGSDVFRIGMSWARKRGWVVVERGVVKLVRFEPLERHRELLRSFLRAREIDPRSFENDEVFQELVKRGLLEVRERKIRVVKLSAPREYVERLLSAKEVVAYLTRDLISSGAWRNVVLKPYNVEALPPTRYPGRKHFFLEFVERVRDVMLAMGFEEIRENYVVPELWNFDVLFQPQDHPARDVYDVFYVEGRADLAELRELVSRAKAVHEGSSKCGSRGWGYSWSLEKASKLMLRSHTTAATIAYIARKREPPARGFCIGRVFRRDRMDATHLPEFTNFDGVVMERGFSFRKLLGLLTQIMRNLGFEKVRFRPAYFPFTEPSVEGAVYIEGVGWVEVFGAGMFRPEVLEIVGANAPVGAWGMGLERLAMAIYRINDIRELYSKDVDKVRSFPARWI